MKGIKVESIKGPSILINMIKCGKCGSWYHFGVEGLGNCPICRKLQSSEQKPKEAEG